jgi:hypothetical protein
MTTIQIRPVREAREWDSSDSSTFNDYLRNSRVVSINTFWSPDITSDIYGVGEVEWRAKGRRDLRRTEWFISTLQATAALLWLTDNWTSGGKRTQKAAVANMLTLLIEVLDNRTPPPSVVPTWRGGVQVEWHRNGIDFEIESDPQGGIEYFFKSPTEEREGRAWNNLSQLVKYARAVAVSE